jgi:outer membrane lipase/esterase
MIIRSALASALILTLAAPAAAETYSALYSFGDSLSDAGNIYLSTGGIEPAPPYAGGVYSNGPLWNQDVATTLGLPLTPSLAGGTDYAFGGATTGFSGTNVPGSLIPTLADQVGAFSLNLGGVAPSSALYTISIGANDLFGILSSGVNPGTAAALAAGAALTEAAAAQTLFSEGARTLIVFDAPNLGVTPSLQGTPYAAAATALSYYYDQQLFADLASVEAAGLRVLDLNTFGLIDAAVGGAFGFSNVTDACYGGPYTGGGTACADPNSYLFWDQVHPTAAAQAIIGQEAAGLAQAVPEASTWTLMLSGFAAMGFAGWRRQRAQMA